MYLTMVLMLWFSSVLFEGFLAYRFKRFRHFMEKAEWAAIVFSVMLSITLGHAFGAEGLVTLMAGVASTVTSPVMYKALGWYFTNEEQVKIYLNQFKQACEGFVFLFLIVGRVLFFLLCIPIKIMMWVDMISSRGRRPSDEKEVRAV